MTKRALSGVLGVLLLFAATVLNPARAQDYPLRQVTIVLPFPAGSPLDDQARSLAQSFEKAWGKPALVENRPGAGSLVGLQSVVNAPADGYTILVTGSTITALKLLIKSITFDPLQDILPVSQLGEFWTFYFTNTQTPVRSIEEFVAYAKANPGKVNYGGAGRNTSSLSVEAFKRIAGVPLTEISYTSQTQSIPALLRNDVQLVPGSLGGGVKGQVDAGAVRVLLVMGNTRSPLLPDVPSSSEKGWNLAPFGWTGVFVRSGTPQPIVNQIAAEVARHVANPAAQARAQASGASLVSSTPAQFRQKVDAEARLWAETTSALGMKPE
jgi:tripartite-type tricarboxylate transporter receptor subunit TctC